MCARCTMPKMDISAQCLNRIYTTYYWLLKTMRSTQKTEIKHEYKALQLRTTTKNHWAERLIYFVYGSRKHRDAQARNFSFSFYWNESLWPLPPPPPLLLLLSLQSPTKWNSKLFFNKFSLLRWPHRLFSHNAIKNAMISKLNNQFTMIYWVLLCCLVCIARGIKYHCYRLRLIFCLG